MPLPAVHACCSCCSYARNLHSPVHCSACLCHHSGSKDKNSFFTDFALVRLSSNCRHSLNTNIGVIVHGYISQIQTKVRASVTLVTACNVSPRCLPLPNQNVFVIFSLFVSVLLLRTYASGCGDGPFSAVGSPHLTGRRWAAAFISGDHRRSCHGLHLPAVQVRSNLSPNCFTPRCLLLFVCVFLFNSCNEIHDLCHTAEKRLSVFVNDVDGCHNGKLYVLFFLLCENILENRSHYLSRIQNTRNALTVAVKNV